MTCKNCGTEIADKALICYRCGQATFEAQRKPVPIGRGGWRPSLVFIGVLLMVLAAAFIIGSFDMRQPPYVPWIVGAVGLVLVAWGLARGLVRRRR